MATNATPQLKALAARWQKAYRTAVFSGIVGDTAHKARGGYHISREDQPGSNYSVIRPDDKGGRDDVASAIDMSLGRADMKVCTQRLVAVFNNRQDPRRKYINAFNGYLGSGSPQRYDIWAQRIAKASADHESHVHLEVRRKYAESALAMDAVFSIVSGQTMTAYQASIGVRASSASVKSAPVASPAYPGHLLRRADGGKADPAVKALQDRMKARGWASVGASDGLFGAKLETVIKAFQKQCGLTADGVVGPTTWPMPWTMPIK